MASSGTRPPSTTLSAASQAAPKPDDSAAREMERGVCLRPAVSMRSMPSTRPAGMLRLIVDSPNALGLATSAGTSESGLRTAGPSPKARGAAATLLPRSARTSTVAALTPTSSSRPCQAGPAMHSRPSTVT